MTWTHLGKKCISLKWHSKYIRAILATGTVYWSWLHLIDLASASCWGTCGIPFMLVDLIVLRGWKPSNKSLQSLLFLSRLWFYKRCCSVHQNPHVERSRKVFPVRPTTGPSWACIGNILLCHSSVLELSKYARPCKARRLVGQNWKQYCNLLVESNIVVI